MTELEHAIKHIKTRADAWAVKEIEKALSQEPCEDAISDIMGISKSRTHDIMENELRCVQTASCGGCDRECGECSLLMDDKEIIKAYGYVIRMLELPSVTQKSGNPQPSEHFIDGVRAMGYREGYKDAQKQKSGKWVDYSDEGYVECPFCGHATNCEDDIDELHYCFYCGARMESEEKE